MEKRENFGRYIKEKRKAAGLSQKELAIQLFVSESAVSKGTRSVLSGYDAGYQFV